MGRERVTQFLASSEETVRFGERFASRLVANDIIALRGDLGAGKTTFVQGLLRGLGIPDVAQSPTFTYLQVYNHVYHFDLYRLKEEHEFVLLGFEEFLDAGGIVVIEWPEKIPSLIPPKTYRIQLEYLGTGRTVTQW